MGFEALDYISIHKKSPHPTPTPSSKFVQQNGSQKSGELHDLDAIKGSGLTGQWGAL